jgi:hypothetical protein
LPFTGGGDLAGCGFPGSFTGDCFSVLGGGCLTIGDFAGGSFTGGLLELLAAVLFAVEGLAAALALLLADALGAALLPLLLDALVFAACVFFADLPADFAGADFDFALFAAALVLAALAGAFAAGFSAFFAGALAAGAFAAGFLSPPPTSARTSPFRLKPDLAGAALFFDLSVFVVFFELTAIPFSRPPWIVLDHPNR